MKYAHIPFVNKPVFRIVLGTFIQAAIRTLCTCLPAPRLGIVGIAFSCAIGWSTMLLFEVPYYFLTCRKQQLDRFPAGHPLCRQ